MYYLTQCAAIIFYMHWGAWRAQNDAACCQIIETTCAGQSHWDSQFGLRTFATLFTNCTQVFCFLVDLCCSSFGLSILLVDQSELLQSSRLWRDIYWLSLCSIYYLANNGQEEESPHDNGLLAPLAWFQIWRGQRTATTISDEKEYQCWWKGTNMEEVTIFSAEQYWTIDFAGQYWHCWRSSWHCFREQ